MEKACPSPLSGGAGEDSVFEQLGLEAAAAAGGVGAGGPPGGVGGQVAFPGSHLMNPSSYKLSQSHINFANPIPISWSLFSFLSFLFFVIMRLLFLGTKSLMQR